MPRYGLALLAFLVVPPAHATLLEYSFEGQLRPFSDETVGLELAGTISGGLLWGDAAPKNAHKETQSGESYTGTASRPTYDMSNLMWWVILGDQTFSARSDDVTPAVWDRTMHGDRYESEGYSVAGYVTRQQVVFATSEDQVVETTDVVHQVVTTIWDSWWAKMLAYGLLAALVLWQGRRVAIGRATADTRTRQHLDIAIPRQSPRPSSSPVGRIGTLEAPSAEAGEAAVEAEEGAIDEPAELVPNSEEMIVARSELDEAALDLERGHSVHVETQDQVGNVAMIEDGERSMAAVDVGPLLTEGATPNVPAPAQEALPSSEIRFEPVAIQASPSVA